MYLVIYIVWLFSPSIQKFTINLDYVYFKARLVFNSFHPNTFIHEVLYLRFFTALLKLTSTFNSHQNKLDITNFPYD